MKTPEKAPVDNHYEAKTDAKNAAPTAASTCNSDNALPNALTPENFTGLSVSPPKTVAGGLPAVVSSLQHIARETGLVKGSRTLLKMNQQGGFDCPGCAWPDPENHRSRFEYCENGAKAIAEEATSKRATPEFFASHSVQELATWSDRDIGKSGRLTHPMILRDGAAHYEPIEWEDAFALIAQHLNALNSPNEAVFYTSGRTSNEAAFLYQLFVREFGTNNLPDCSNMCHESSGCALTETLGVGKGTVSLRDFEHADLIWVVGQNPGTNHPRMLTALQKAARNGCRIVHINPLHETGLSRFIHPQEPLHLVGDGTPLETLHLPVRINGDVALFKGIAKAMVAAFDAGNDVFDREFIAQHTVGFEAFCDDVRTANWDEIVENSGIEKSQIEAAAQLAMQSKRSIACWAMGLTQHKNAVANIQSIVNLLLLGGHIGREGAGVCPVRGHSNVQGDRTMGIWERPGNEFLDALEREFGFSPPREHGWDVVDGIKAMHDGKVRVFFALGGNFLSASPDTDFTAEALRRCDLTVHVSTKPHRGHLVTGKTALILPCLGRTERDVQDGTEQFVSVENSMGVVHSSRGGLEPASQHLLSEPQIVARLAQSTLNGKSKVNWRELAVDYDKIRDRIERVVVGFDDFNRRVREPSGFVLPNTARDRVWKTASGRAQFSVHPLPENLLRDGQFLMMTIRSHDQYNTTIYGLDDRYRGIHNERRVVMLNAQDIAEAGLKAGDVVDLIGHWHGKNGAETREANKFIVVEYAIPRRCAATYFPETNVLIPVDSVAEKSNTPTSKSVVISLRRHIEA